jgi:hypothetical protein
LLLADGLSVALLSTGAAVLGVVGLAVLVADLIIPGLIGSALSGTFDVALYRYAVGEDSSRFFPTEPLTGAFREKWEPGQTPR